MRDMVYKNAVPDNFNKWSVINEGSTYAQYRNDYWHTVLGYLIQESSISTGKSQITARIKQ